MRCAAARHVPRTVGFGVFLVHCAGGNVAGVTGAVSDALSAKDEGYRAVEHEDTRIKIVRVRLAMPMWFDLAFASLVTLLSEVGFKFAPDETTPTAPAETPAPEPRRSFFGRLFR